MVIDERWSAPSLLIRTTMQSRTQSKSRLSQALRFRTEKKRDMPLLTMFCGAEALEWDACIEVEADGDADAAMGDVAVVVPAAETPLDESGSSSLESLLPCEEAEVAPDGGRPDDLYGLLSCEDASFDKALGVRASERPSSEGE